MKKKITVIIALLCIISMMVVLVACDKDGDNSSKGDKGKDGLYKLPEIDDSGYDYSKAFVIEDNTVVGLTEYGRTLEKLVVPDGITHLNEYALAGDEDDENVFAGPLKIVELPSSLKSIGDFALFLNFNLVSVNLPEGLEEIGDGAFAMCSSLLELNIPSTLTKVGEYVFMHSNSLVLKTNGSDLIDDLKSNLLIDTELEEQYKIPVVYNCKSNEVADDGYVYTVEKNGVEYGLKDGKAIVKGHANLPSEVVIADKISYNGKEYVVDEIGMYAFCEIVGVTDFKIPSAVKSIRAMAFAGCTGLTKVVLPDKLTVLDGLAFKSCILIEEIEIPSGVTRIGDEAFGDCYALEKIFIPSSVVKIDASAFYSCGKLTIYCEAEEKPVGWNDRWNSSNRPVEWNYKAN